MLDLNIDAVFSVESVSCEEEDRGVKTTTAGSLDSTTNNNAAHGAAADEVVDCGSSARRKSLFTLNFSILDKGRIEIEDDLNNEAADSRSELQLFPMGALSQFPLSSPSFLSTTAPYCLNLSAPETADGGGLELGIYKPHLAPASKEVPQPQVKKSRRGPRSRSSQYRGVTFYRRTGRWESHIWDCGKQVYLGGFDTAHAAARAYDRAAIKFRGVDADINFTIGDYEEDMKELTNLTKQEFIHILRRQSTGFSRGSLKYRGVALYNSGRWEAKMSQFLGKMACDQDAIKCNGREAVTKFEPSNYERDIIDSKGGGSASNLDLNLGMSLPSDGPHGNSITRDLQISHASNELPHGKKSKVETVSASPQGFGMSIKCAPVWAAGMHSDFCPDDKERSMRGEEGIIPLSPGFTLWKMKTGSSGFGPKSPSSSAASSRFSPSTLIPQLHLARLQNRASGRS